MNLVIVHSLSKLKTSLEIAQKIEGDLFQIEHFKKPIKSYFFQMIVYGFRTVANRAVKIKPLDIDFDKYTDIYLVSPVWAGRVNAYMRQFLNTYKFKDKKVHLIGSCLGGYEHYFESFYGLIDASNEIVEKIIYVKGELVK